MILLCICQYFFLIHIHFLCFLKYISQINTELHAVLLPEFEKAENGYYMPEINEIAVYQCSPFAELRRFSLKS